MENFTKSRRIINETFPCQVAPQESVRARHGQPVPLGGKEPREGSGQHGVPGH